MSTENRESTGFSQAEREAMKARSRELALEKKAAKKKEEWEKAALKAIDSMQEPDKAMATRLHELICTAAPELWPKTMYGMPAYASPEGKVLCFFQGASKFGTRYSTLGFNESAKLDEGDIWATSFAITNLTKEVEKKILELLKKALGQ